MVGSKGSLDDKHTHTHMMHIFISLKNKTQSYDRNELSGDLLGLRLEHVTYVSLSLEELDANQK